MSRCGPPGHDATERHSTEPRCQTESTRPEALGGVRPEVAVVCETIGVYRPSKQLMLQRLYDKFMQNAQTDYDFGGYVLTYLTREGSRPVDLAVGERVARRLTGARA